MINGSLEFYICGFNCIILFEIYAILLPWIILFKSLFEFSDWIACYLIIRTHPFFFLFEYVAAMLGSFTHRTAYQLNGEACK